LIDAKTASSRYLLAANRVGLSDLSAFAISAFRTRLHGQHVLPILDRHLLYANHVDWKWVLLLGLLVTIVAAALVVLLDLPLLVCLQLLTLSIELTCAQKHT